MILKKETGQNIIAKLDKLRFSTGPYSTAKIRNEMQLAMQNYAAVFRI